MLRRRNIDDDSRSSFDSPRTHMRIDRTDSSTSEERMQMGYVFRFICQIKLKIRSCFFIFVEFGLVRLSFVVSCDDKLISTSERERQRERETRERERITKRQTGVSHSSRRTDRDKRPFLSLSRTVMLLFDRCSSCLSFSS